MIEDHQRDERLADLTDKSQSAADLRRNIRNPTRNPDLHKLLVAYSVPIRVLKRVDGADIHETAKRYPPGAGWEKAIGPAEIRPDWASNFRGTTNGALAVLGARLGPKTSAGQVIYGLDVIDVDPRSDGIESWDELVEAGAIPEVLAWQATPSGGWHAFVKALDRGKISGLKPGLDYLAGKSDGSSRAFVYLAPTVGIARAGDFEGEDVPYRAADLRANLNHLPSGLDADERQGRFIDALDAYAEAKKTPKSRKAPGGAPPEPDIAPGRDTPSPARPEPVPGREIDPRADDYVRYAVAAELQPVRELHGLAWDVGHGHDVTVFTAACALLDLAHSPWNRYSVLAAKRDWTAALDPAYDDRWKITKWSSAERAVSGNGRDEPIFTGSEGIGDDDLITLGSKAASYDEDDPFGALGGITALLDPFEREVAKEVSRLRVRAEAKRLFEESETPAAEPSSRVVTGSDAWGDLDDEATESGAVGAPRDDGVKLLYAGKWHTAIASTGVGKSTWARLHVAAVLAEGGRVAYAHFEESSNKPTLKALRTIGVTEEQAARFFWLQCGSSWPTGGFAEALSRAAADGPIDLLILDGINRACTTHGRKPEDVEAVGWYAREFVAPATETGAAVLSLGHPPKAVDRQDERHGFGSTAWLDEVDGVGFRLTNGAEGPPRIDQTGSIIVQSVKDRPGGVERHGELIEGKPGWMRLGLVVIEPGAPARFLAPLEQSSRPHVPAEVAEAVVRILRGNIEGLSWRKLKLALRDDGLKFRDEELSSHLQACVDSGSLDKVDGPRAAQIYSLSASSIAPGKGLDDLEDVSEWGLE